MEQYMQHRAVAANALQEIAKEISDRSGLHKLQELFTEFDADESGGLSEQEFGKALERYGASLSSKQLSNIFQVLDADDNGTIDIDEFSAIAKCELEILTLDQAVGQGSGLEIQRAQNEKVTEALKSGVRLNRSASVAMDPRMQGDVEMLTASALMKREELKENTAVFEQVQAWWNKVVFKSSGEMTKESYIICSVGSCRMILSSSPHYF
jgi:Ca2+-binding EF-hand superfamily protein